MATKIPPSGTKPGLQPLPADASTQGLRPISVSGNAGPPSAERHVDVVAEGNPVETWIAEHPEEPRVETPAEPVAETPATDVPAAVTAEPKTEAAPVVAEAKPTEEAQAPAVVATEANAVPATEATADPAAAKPAELAKPTYASDERFSLGANADGTPVEWTRAQIVEAVTDRLKLQPLAQETEGWRSLFGDDFANAESNWKPLLTSLREKPELTILFDNVLHDDGLADYLQRSADHFAQERAAGNVPPAASKPQERNVPQDPVVARELAELKAWRAQREQAELRDRATAEIGRAVAEFPFLAQDRGLLQELCDTADFLRAKNPAWGMAEALASKRSIYGALATVRGAQRVAPPQATPEVPVPALLGSAGASPGGSRPVDNGRPKKFEDLGDGVEAWLQQHPS